MAKKAKVVPMPDTYGRYMLVNENTGEILDDAQGYGYRSPQKAHAAWNYKHPSNKSAHNRKINKRYLKTHSDLSKHWAQVELWMWKDGEQAGYQDFKDFMQDYDPDFKGNLRSLYSCLQRL